ncbi:MAG: hypothetical protein FWF90_13275 [Promicromonosporaceae bacterium]|nr:hypothetical protein [Promicromonosporaceae bacterium]
MWEVFGPIIRWPLYSPRRFLAVAAVALVAVFLIGSVNGHGGPGTGSASPTPPVSAGSWASGAPSSSSANPVAGGLAAASDDLSVDPAAGDPTAAAADAAAAFVAAWARPDRSQAAWAAGVRPLVTHALWTTGLSLTEPSSTPAETVAGEPRQVAVTAHEDVFDVPTTGAWVRVHLVPGPAAGAWLVSTVEPGG